MATTFSAATHQSYVAPEDMLMDLRNEMTVIKSEEASLKKQITSLNEQFQELMISVAELYPDILSKDYAVRNPGYPGQARYPSPGRRKSPERTLSYRYSPELLKDRRGSLLSEWRESRLTSGEGTRRRRFSERAEPAERELSRERSPNRSRPHLEKVNNTNSKGTRLSKQNRAIENDLHGQEVLHTPTKERAHAPEVSVNMNVSVTPQAGLIDGASVGVDSPSDKGVKSNAADSERRKRIKQRLKESRKKLDVIHLGLF